MALTINKHSSLMVSKVYVTILEYRESSTNRSNDFKLPPPQTMKDIIKLKEKMMQ